MPDKKQQNKTLSGSITPDYSFVDAIARVAIYDGLGAAPKVLEITPDKTNQFIEHLTDVVNEEAYKLGGNIPYSAIRQGVENLIHAHFHGCVISIMDGGNTIRIADHGPGIKNIEDAVKPGYSSANEAMQKYIRGVGSGIPLMRDSVQFHHGHININSNLNSGTVLTISVDPNSPEDEPVLEYQQGDEEPHKIYGDVRDGIQYQGTRENVMNRYDKKAQGDHYGQSSQIQTNHQNQMPHQQQIEQPNNQMDQAQNYSQSSQAIPPQQYMPVQNGYSQMPQQNSYPQPTYTQNNQQATYQPYIPSYQQQQSTPMQPPVQNVQQGAMQYPQVNQGLYPSYMPQASPYTYPPHMQQIPSPNEQSFFKQMVSQLKETDKSVLSVLFIKNPMPVGPTVISNEIGMAKGTAHNVLERLTKMGLARREGQQHVLTDQGKQVAQLI